LIPAGILFGDVLSRNKGYMDCFPLIADHPASALVLRLSD
jgi:hypothetical protein